jgi:hypothetical protein
MQAPNKKSVGFFAPYAFRQGLYGAFGNPQKARSMPEQEERSPFKAAFARAYTGGTLRSGFTPGQ